MRSPQKILPIILRCLALLKPYYKLVVGAYVASLGINAVALLTPQIIRRTVDSGIRGGQLDLLPGLLGALLLMTIAKGVFIFFRGRWSETASQGVAYDIRNAIHQKLSHLSFAYHDQTETGDLLSRSIQDVDRLRFLTGRALLMLIESTVLLIGTAVFLFLANPALAAVTMLTMPVLAYRGLHFGSLYRPLSMRIQEQLATLTARVEQNLRGARVVKAFAQEEAEIERFDDENRRWFDLSATAVRLRAWNIPLLGLIGDLGMVAIIWFGGYLVVRETLSLGELVAFITYLSQLVRPIRRLGMIIPSVTTAAAAGERIAEVLDVESEVSDRPGARPVGAAQGMVRFSHVSLAYFGRETILHDVSFTASPGQIIALLGTTGSGKTSIVNLIPRFYDPTEGAVTLDGDDLRNLQLQSLRSQVGIVLQDTTLFATSIRQNIAFGRPDASQGEIEEVARAAQAHGFIQAMPDGYDTAVGERGDTLSGGQKQRIAIARALLHDPRILILDDATASVDTETEMLIQKALDTLMEGRTTFVIAQRLSTIRKAHQTLVMHRGRIAAQGSHQDLLRTSGIYVDIYNRQLKAAEGETGGHL